MIASLLLGAWMFLVSGAHVTAVVRHVRARRVPRASGSAPAALLVRPLAGDEPDLRKRLGYTAGVGRVLLCVDAATDLAHASASAAASALRARGVEAAVVLTGAEGPNHKVDQIARAVARTVWPWDVLVVCDSDVMLEHVDLSAALGRFVDPDLAVVWLAPVPERAVLSFGDRGMQAVLAGSLHAFPLLAHIDRGGLVGKTMLIRRATLDAAGGFDSLRHHLGEDMELGRRVRAAGGRIELSHAVVTTAARAVTTSAAVERFARWIAVNKAQRAALLWSYPLLFAATTPALVLACAGASRVPLLLVPAAALLVTRCAVWWTARSAAGHRHAPLALLVDLVLADALLWAAFLRVVVARPLTWRGRALVLGPERRLQG